MLNEQGTIPERINFAIPIDECLSILAATGIKLIFSPDSLPLLPADEVFENVKQSVVFVTSISAEQEEKESSIAGPVANPQVLAAVTAWEQEILNSDPSYIIYQKRVYSRITEIVTVEGQPTDPVYAVHIANQALSEVKNGLGFAEGRALNLVAQQFRFFPNLDPGELANSFSDPSEMNGKRMTRESIAEDFRKYATKWPIRKATITNLIASSTAPGKVSVRAATDFEVRDSTGSGILGSASYEVFVEQSASKRPLITRWNEKVTKRKKHNE